MNTIILGVGERERKVREEGGKPELFCKDVIHASLVLRAYPNYEKRLALGTRMAREVQSVKREGKNLANFSFSQLTFLLQCSER